MAEIYPTILTDQFEIFQQQVRAAEGFARLLHIDIADGRFVPSRSITSADLQAVAPTIPFEIHLMVDHPDDVVGDYVAVGAKRIIVHHGKGREESEQLFRQIREAGCEAALGVSPMTSMTDLVPYLSFLQQITFLAVEPGFQGGALVPGVIHTVRGFRMEHAEIPVEVDGGIKLTNVEMVAETGADRFVIGSGIWKTENPAATYEAFVSQFEKAFSSHAP